MTTAVERHENYDLEPCLCGGTKFNVWETSLVAVVEVTIDDGDGVYRNYAEPVGPEYPHVEARCVQCGRIAYKS